MGNSDENIHVNIGAQRVTQQNFKRIRFFLVSHKNTSMALALFSTQAIFDGVNERCVGRYVQSPGFNAENN